MTTYLPRHILHAAAALEFRNATDPLLEDVERRRLRALEYVPSAPSLAELEREGTAG